ncbi:Kiwa anti-phage protein KwaB-like domain-containing protein [Bacillus cereus group sp. Sample30]|uniref:Kiwa anti-phage protein KwaB-like domain-containing protein n=1 Tax=Bacillus cereus group sp. Sample30 TaxID=2816449 RepID=UPI002FDBFEB3
MEGIIRRLIEARETMERLEIHYITKSRNTALTNQYTKFEISVPMNVANEIKDLVFGNLVEKLTGLELREHDPVISEANTLEHLPLYEVDNFENIVSAPEGQVSELDFGNIWGYTIKVYFGQANHDIVFFKKFAYPRLLKKSIKLRLRNDIFDVIESEVVTIDDVIHSFSLDGTMFILNKAQFEKLFNFSSTYQQYVNQSVETLEELHVIENFEQFTNDCLESDTLTRRLVKTIKDERFENLQRNITNVPRVIDEFALNVHFVDDKIVYGDGSTITDIITLIKGACVYGALDDERYIASDTKSLRR